MKLFNWLKHYVPKYAVLPLLGCLALNMLVYYGSRLFNLSMTSYDLSLPLDHRIPLGAAVYRGLHAVVCILVVRLHGHCRRQPGARRHAVWRDDRQAHMPGLFPDPAHPDGAACGDGNDIFSRLVRFIYWTDVPNNLFPSIHCMESHLCWRGLARCRRVPKWVKIAAFILSLAIYASTVLVRQHLVLDIPAGILVGEIGLWISRRLRLGERYAARWRIAHEA